MRWPITKIEETCMRKALWLHGLCGRGKDRPITSMQSKHGGGGKNIDLSIRDSGIRRRRVVSATPKPFNLQERGRVPILQEAGYVRKTLPSPPPRLKPRTVQPAASRYTDWSVPTAFMICALGKIILSLPCQAMLQLSERQKVSTELFWKSLSEKTKW